MKSFLRTAWKMLRFRSVLVLVLFMLLSVALHTDSKLIAAPYIIAGIVMLAFSYLCATCVNDLVDWKIDLINLKDNTERPLANGLASRKQLIILAVVGAVVSIGVGYSISTLLGVVMVVSIVLNTLYSLPPIRVAYRALLTPFYLSLCYVVVSFVVGYLLVVEAGNVSPSFEWLYLLGFYSFFVARISLKDFRDRKGDAAANKPTILSKYGKTTVILLSSSAVLTGTLILMYMSLSDIWMLLTLIAFASSIGIVEYRLYHSKKLNQELLSVAYGARMGNGLLLTYFGCLLLQGSNAPQDVMVIFIFTMIFLYGYLFWMYLKYSEQFLIGGRRLKMK
jgi:4-hydroxybenzoate polyprenyltransferase